MTAIADFAWGYENETLCTAHAHGVRVLGFNQLPMAVLNDWHSPSNNFFTNTTAVDAWVQAAARFTYDYGMDGIMLDIEGVGNPSRPVPLRAMQAFGCESATDCSASACALTSL